MFAIMTYARIHNINRLLDIEINYIHEMKRAIPACHTISSVKDLKTLHKSHESVFLAAHQIALEHMFGGERGERSEEGERGEWGEGSERGERGEEGEEEGGGEGGYASDYLRDLVSEFIKVYTLKQRLNTVHNLTASSMDHIAVAGFEDPISGLLRDMMGKLVDIVHGE